MCSWLKLAAAHQFVMVLYSNQPDQSEIVEDAFVQVFSLKNELLYQGITDDKGKVSFSLDDTSPIKKVMVHVSHLNFIPLVDTISIADSESLLSLKLIKRDYNLDEMVVTAQYNCNLASKAVQKVKVISAEKAQSMGAVTLNDVLANELNIRLSQDNILGAGLSIQGVSGQNVKILIDGVPVIGRLDGNIDLSQINLNDIERIELIEGPLSVSYGTNALAGTINIITKKQAVNKGLHGNVKAQFENIGTHNLQMGTQYAKKNTTLRFSGGRNYFDGWKEGEQFWPNYKPQLANSNRFLQWKPKEQWFGRFNVNHNFKNSQINYTLNAFDEQITNRGLPQAPYQIVAFDDYYKTLRFDNTLSLNQKLNSKSNLYAHVAYNFFRREKTTYVNDLTTLNKVLSDNDGSQDTSVFDLWNIRAIYQKEQSKFWSYQIGFEGNLEQNQGERIEGQIQSINDFALFTSTEILPIKRLTLRPGLRYAYNSAYRAPLVPSLHAKLSSKNNKWTHRASYAKGFRAPSVKELYFVFVDLNHNIIGNDNLLAETSNNFNLSTSKSIVYNKSVLGFELSNFANIIDNKISLAQIDNNQYSYINIGTFKSIGSNITFTLRSKAINTKLSFAINGQQNGLNNGQEANWSSNHQVVGNFGYTFTKYKLQLNSFFNYQSSLTNITVSEEGELLESKIQSYTLIDLMLNKGFFNKKIQINTGCKNILNIQNLQISGNSGGTHSSNAGTTSMAMGRYWLFSVNYNF